MVCLLTVLVVAGAIPTPRTTLLAPDTADKFRN
jgi:hypothetical protein